MSRSNRPKEKYGKSTELDGTAARTRPFSFDEIMLRRKNKKLYGDVKDRAGEEGHMSRKDIVKNISDRYESERGYKHNKESLPGDTYHSSEKVTSRKKDESTSMKEGYLDKVKDKERLLKESHDSEDKLKAKPNKVIADKSKEGRTDQRVHGRKKIDERSRRSSDDSESESEKKFSRDSAGKDKYADRGRKSEKASKRKHRTGADDKNRDKNYMKKHDPGKRLESEYLDRKERRESPPPRYEESRSKRRRSRSRELDKDRDKRSSSLSPRAQKRTSHHGREHAEISSHSLKDRSGRQHSDADRTRVSNNGSSSHFRRHGGSASGLGGYSPRKRRTEAAIKTPSPTNRSPEKKSAGWDLPPAKADGINASSALSSSQVIKPTVSSNADELPGAVPVPVPVNSTISKLLPGIYSDVSTNKTVSIDSIQLTQATRPMRRLYVENLPALSSEKALMEFLNNFLLSSGVNHVQGAQPCISCTIHKEKGQALVEFLTPEDASAALSFDSISFSGSILKIRRPKDFVDMTGVQDKLVAAPDAISDIVKDSPHKIFIGGISRALSSDMLMEIAAAFGPLKAFCFQVNEDLGEPCAFLEYVDQSVTPKACAGLNGMKLGGQVLTVVQAIPNVLSMDTAGNLPFYGIPEHAKPLLERPTQVLKLKNVVNPDDLSSLSELDLEEILEDVRLECARFGTVKSVNIVKDNKHHLSSQKAYEAVDNTSSDLGCDGNSMNTETLGGTTDNGTTDISGVWPPVGQDTKEDDVVERGNDSDLNSTIDLRKDEPCEVIQVDSNIASGEPGCPVDSDGIPEELPGQLNSTEHELEVHDDKVTDVSQDRSMTADELEETDRELGTSAELDGSPGTKPDATGKNGEKSCELDDDDMFEIGCVLVEYARTEASCMAAHCLHGRYFDDQVVNVGYVALDLYRKKFPR